MTHKNINNSGNVFPNGLSCSINFTLSVTGCLTGQKTDFENFESFWDGSGSRWEHSGGGRGGEKRFSCVLGSNKTSLMARTSLPPPMIPLICRWTVTLIDRIIDLSSFLVQKFETTKYQNCDNDKLHEKNFHLQKKWRETHFWASRTKRLKTTSGIALSESRNSAPRFSWSGRGNPP